MGGKWHFLCILLRNVGYRKSQDIFDAETTICLKSSLFSAIAIRHFFFLLGMQIYSGNKAECSTRSKEESRLHEFSRLKTRELLTSQVRLYS
jgi:hypothetical protein